MSWLGKRCNGNGTNLNPLTLGEDNGVLERVNLLLPIVVIAVVVVDGRNLDRPDFMADFDGHFL